jgi:hypothetical protein
MVRRNPARQGETKMATWHQMQHPVKLYHATEWTVVIDPPHQMRALMLFSSKALAEVYMRNLADNNPGAHKHSYIVRPTSAGIYGE